MWWIGAAVLWATPADHFELTTWTTTEGLPQSSVNAIDQAADGTLVVGTYAGLVRFDGRDFLVVDPAADSEWSGLRVTAVEVVASGSVVVGTQDGRLLRVEDGGFEVQPVPESFDGHPIWSLSSSGETLWVAGSGGVAVFDGRDWSTVSELDGASSVLADTQGSWVGADTGIVRVEGGKVEPLAVEVGAVRALCRGPRGVFAAGDAGVVRIGARETTLVDRRPTTELTCASDGTVWASAGRELWALGGTQRVSLGHPVSSVFEDRERNLWVGTDGGGLTRITPEDWTLTEIPGGALATLPLADDALLVAGYCGAGGLYVVRRDEAPVQVSDVCARALASDGEGVLVGADTEILRWSESEVLQPVVDVGDRILALTPTDDGLWIGTDTKGAMRWREGRLERIDVGDRRVLSIVEGPSGELWFGTHWGLSRMVGDSLTRWTRDDGVPPGPIRGLHVEDGLVLMASYGGGLGIFQHAEFRRLNAASGLLDNAVSAVIDDGRGAFWVNGNRGLARILRADLHAWLAGQVESPRTRLWDSPEGNGGGQPAGTLLDDGSLAVPTTLGVVALDPSEVFRNPVQPDVVLMEADVDGINLDPSQTIRVPPGPGRVHIGFTAATLRHPELATLEYRLLEADSTEAPRWQLAPEGTIAWGGLPPGAHVVELRATNEDGVQSAVMRLPFEIEPQLHQRWTFWLGVASLFIAMGAWAHLWRTRAIAAKNRELEREVRQRVEAEAENRKIARRLSVAERLEAVGRLAGGIAHDFNNLLTAVAGTSSVLRSDCRASEAPLLDNLDHCVVRGASLTRRLLAFARQQPMDPTRVDVGAQLYALLPILETSIRDDIALRLDVRVPRLGLEVDPTLLELAIVNLVLNSADAMPVGGHLDIVVERLEDDDRARRFPGVLCERAGPWVVLSVRDDGDGMSSEVISKVREPFFTTRAHGNGLGLSSVDGFVAQSGGAMHIESQPHVGTTVSLILPFVEAPEVVAAAEAEVSPTVVASRVLLCDDDDLVRESLVRVLGCVPFP